MEVPTKEIAKYKFEIARAGQFAGSLVVKSQIDYEMALEEGKSIKTQLETITSRKEEITKPLNAALKSVRDLFKPIETMGEDALRTIKSKMLAYTAEQNRKAEEEKLKLAKKVETGYIKPETAVARMGAIVEPEKTVVTEAGKATTKMLTKYRVINKAEIPLDFMEPDMVKIKVSFRAGMPVKGVEEYQEANLNLG